MSSDLAADATPLSAPGSLTADAGGPSGDGELRAGAAVSLHDVSVGYGGVTVLGRLSLRIDRGELVGIAGPSGSGKTTLLRLLTGRADHHHGDVEVLGARVRAGGTPADVAYVPQLDTIDWDFPLTVEQVVLLGDAARSAPVPWFRRAERREARAVLERLGIGALHGRRIRELSGGQRQRMFLARALLRRSRLLLLDEPTSGVDPSTRRDVLAVLGDLHAQGLTIVLTTHDLNFVASHLPRIVCLNGSITADGDPGTVLTPASLERTYGAPMKVLRDGGRAVVVDADDLRLPALGAGHLPPPPAAPTRPDPDTELWP